MFRSPLAFLIHNFVKLWPFPRAWYFHPILIYRYFPRFHVASLEWFDALIDPNDFVDRWWFQGQGKREKASLDAIEKTFTADGAFLDIGAHHGFYSLFVASKTSSPYRIFAIEPNHSAFARLLDNKNLNKFNNIVAQCAAASSNVGQINLYLPSAGNTGTASSSSHGMDTSRLASVPTVTVDDLVTTNQISVVDCMKIDVQGGEVGVIKGSSASLENGTIRNIYLEFHPAEIRELNHDSQELTDLLEKFGRLYLLESDATLTPITAEKINNLRSSEIPIWWDSGVDRPSDA